jgi:hypothetical protein
MKKVIKPKTESFEELVKGIASIKNCYKENLGALTAKDKKVVTGTGFCGSVHLDDCQTGKRPQGQKRWDYIICHEKQLYFVEVHSPDTSEISVVEGKAQMLKDFLNGEGAALKKMKANAPYYWVASPGANFDIKPAGKKIDTAALNRLLAKKGIRYASKLSFPI